MESTHDIAALQKEIKDLKEQLASQRSMFEMTTNYLNKLKKDLEVSENNLRQVNKSMLSSIEYAKHIQDAFLVNKAVLQSVFPDSFLYFKPKDIVSGDFVWMQKQGDEVYLALGDCTGHGVPGAMLSVFMISQLNEIVLNCPHCLPAEIVLQLNSHINTYLKQYNANIKDSAEIAVLRYNTQSNELLFSGAKRPLVLVYADELSIYPGNVFYLGDSIRSVEQPTDTRIIPAHGSILYLLSDGFQDQFGGARNKKFGRNNLYQVLKELSILDIHAQEQALNQIFETWRNNQTQVDDVTIIGIKWNKL